MSPGGQGRPLTLGDLVRGPTPAHQLGVLLCDAFAMANACGGTPLSRPEDIEIHPEDRSVYIAFTDERSDTIGGSPDLRLFPGAADADPGSYGAIFRLVEQDNDPAATTFSWGRFLTGQEASSRRGGLCVCRQHGLLARWGSLDDVTSRPRPSTLRIKGQAR